MAENPLQSSMNRTDNFMEPSDCSMGNTGRLVSIILGVSITVFGTFGNMAVCIAFTIGPRQAVRSCSKFIICLAICDLLNCLMVLPLDIIYWVDFPLWRLGPIVCKLWNSLFFAFLTISSLCMTAMSLDIYFAVFKPLSYRSVMTNRLCRKIIASIWIYGCLLGILFYIFQKEPPRNTYNFEIPTAIYGFYLITHLCIPSIIVPALYFQLFRVSMKHAIYDQKLRQKKFSYVFRGRRFKLRDQEIHVGSKEALAISPLVKIEEAMANSKGKGGFKLSMEVKDSTSKPAKPPLKKTEELRLAKTFLFVSFGFLCLWAPFTIVQLFYVFDLQYILDACHLSRADTVVTWFSYIQCCLNPVIYSLQHHKVRANLRQRLCRCKCLMSSDTTEKHQQ